MAQGSAPIPPWHDKDIAWHRKRVFRGANQLATLVTAATGPVSSDAGASTLAEITTAGLAGLKLTATTDLVQDCFPVPFDYDIAQPSYWRVWWTSDTAAVTKTFTATMKYKSIGAGTAIAAAATALDTAIASDTSPGANKLAITAWGKMAGSKLTRGQKLLSVSFQAAGTCATKTIWIVGYEFEYTPRKTAGTGGAVKMSSESARVAG